MAKLTSGVVGEGKEEKQEEEKISNAEYTLYALERMANRYEQASFQLENDKQKEAQSRLRKIFDLILKMRCKISKGGILTDDEVDNARKTFVRYFL